MMVLEMGVLAVGVSLFWPAGSCTGQPLLERCVGSWGFRHPRMRTSGLLVLHNPQEYLVQGAAFPLRESDAVQAGRFLHCVIGLFGKLLQLSRRESKVLSQSKDVLTQAEDQDVVFHERADRAGSRKG